MPASPVVATSDLVTYEVKVNGNAIDDAYNINFIRIENRINKIPFCEIEILDGSPDTEDFPISDSETFVPGNSIEVLTGYENHNQIVFKGTIVMHSIRIGKNEGPVLSIICKDSAVKMTKGRKNAYYTETTDSDIISGLIGSYALASDVAATSDQLKEVIQYDASDWDFMISRADINGLLVIVNNGAITVKSPDTVTNEILTLTYGEDILEFEADIDSENQFKSITCSAWDVKTQTLASESKIPENFDIGNLNASVLSKVLNLSSFNLQSAGFLESSNLTSWAKAKAVKSQYSKMRGTIKFQGNATVVPAVLIDLIGVGSRFDGKGFVSGVVHKITDGNWITTAELGISPEWFTAETKTESPMAAGLLPGIQGLQIGIVKQIDSDPEGEWRVKIDLPLIGSDGKGVWARLGNFYASSGFGAFFYPEINDEVIVGFFNDDPRYPVILGSLYSSSRSNEFIPDAKNNIKGFTSRSMMKIEFQEDTKTITLTTPGENKIVFSDDDKSIKLSDQNSNSITMNSNGIEISSSSNITIKAAQAMTIQAVTGATVKVSGGDLSMEALNVSNKGDLSFKAQGGVSSQLTASGEVKIQGALVMIN